MKKVNSNFSKYFFYYPATLLKFEPIMFLIQKYRKQQYLSTQELEERQFNLLKKRVFLAYTHSKFYYNLYKSFEFHPDDIESISDITKIPTVKKTDLIRYGDDFAASRFHPFSSSKTTGGSTGQPIQLLKNPMALARERAATIRGYSWAGISLGDSQLRLWGIPHSHQDALKSKFVDLVANRKRISAFQLTDFNLYQYYKVSIKFKPKFIYGYVSAIEEFANFIERKGLDKIPSLIAIVTTSEILFESSRKNIESAFGVKVFNEYGCGEVGSIAHECEEGSLHITADNLIIETDSEKGEAGELIVTDLYNSVNPLIRYRLGDFGSVLESKCRCGRNLPILGSIKGRAYDLLLMPDGRLVHPESVIYVFEDIQKRGKVFEQFQVIQNSLIDLDVYVVPRDKFSPKIMDDVEKNLKSVLHADVNVNFFQVDSIERENSGKMRVVKRNFQA